MATHLVKLTCMATVQMAVEIEVEAPDDATPEEIGKIAVQEAKDGDPDWNLDHWEGSDIDEDSIQAMGEFDSDDDSDDDDEE